jgi:hypothetical protein
MPGQGDRYHSPVGRTARTQRDRLNDGWSEGGRAEAEPPPPPNRTSLITFPPPSDHFVMMFTAFLDAACGRLSMAEVTTSLTGRHASDNLWPEVTSSVTGHMWDPPPCRDSLDEQNGG